MDFFTGISKSVSVNCSEEKRLNYKIIGASGKGNLENLE